MKTTLRFCAWCCLLILSFCPQDIKASGTPQFDVTPPVLESLTFDPTEVDVTGGPATVTVTLHLTDDLSGVDFFDPARAWDGSLNLSSPSYSQFIYVNTTSFTLIPPTDPDYLDTTWQATVTIPQGAEPGLWFVNGLTIYDRAGNYLYSPVGATFNVVSNPDTTPPVVSELQFLPDGGGTSSSITVDTSSSSQTVNIQFRVTDDNSGFGGPEDGAAVNDYNVLQITAQFPVSETNTYNNNVTYYAHRVSGTPQDGIWETTLYFPQYSPAGTWTLSINIKDNALNSTYVSGADLGLPGDPPELNIASNPSDSAAPTLNSLSFSPITIDTSASDQTVNASISLTDDLAGGYYAFIFVQSPSGKQQRYISCWLQNPVPGLTQVLEGTSLFPRYSEGGTWKVQSAYLFDNAGNTRYIIQGDPDFNKLSAGINIIFATLNTDGTVDSTGGTIQDAVYGDLAQVIVPPGAVSQDTTVAIDVLQEPLSVPLPTGFAGANTYYVNIHLDPVPDFPLPPPGLTVVLPLTHNMTPGTVLALYRINTGTGELEPAISVFGSPVTGTVDLLGKSATFTGISRLSTVVGLLPEPVITWANPANITYGTALSGTQLNATANLPGTFVYTPSASTVLSAGNAQELHVTFTPDDNVNYTAVQKTVLINVSKASLTIRADDKTKLAGSPLPTFTASYEGFVNGDKPANLTSPVLLQTAATAASPAGNYDITASGATSPNYEIAFAKGKLTILPAITLKAISYPLILSKRLSATLFEYTYKFVIKNESASPAHQVSATLNKWPSQVTVLDGALTFGTVPAGQSVTSQDTFVLRVDRSKPLKNTDLGWTLTYSSDTGGTISATVQLPF